MTRIYKHVADELEIIVLPNEHADDQKDASKNGRGMLEKYKNDFLPGAVFKINNPAMREVIYG